MPKDRIAILYVEDDADDFFLLQAGIKKLKGKTYVLDRAVSFEEAVEKAKQPYDVFLLDYMLGKTNGLELLKRLKEISRFTPVIILTGMEDAELDTLALRAGASDYLIKGNFTPHELERAIRYAIRDAGHIEALEINATRFQTIFDRSADLIALINQAGTISDANPSFKKLFSDTVATAPDFFSYFTDENDLTKFKAALSAHTELIDFAATLSPGREKQSSFVLNLLPHDPQAGTFLVLLEDITSRKEKEEEELIMQKFSSTGRVARVLAHEIKNPLTNITLAAGQLHAELQAMAAADSVPLVEMIERNSKRINELLNQLLYATRFTDIAAGWYAVNQLIEEALEQTQDYCSGKAIIIEKQFNCKAEKVWADAEKIKIVLVNLIINAIDAMEANGGTLTLRSDCPAEHDIIIEVADTGCGLSKEQQEKIFEPFYTSKSNGTGLGLTNAQNIMLSHKGTLKMKSKLNRGTTFSLLFHNPADA